MSDAERSAPALFGDLRQGTLQGRAFSMIRYILKVIFRLSLGYRVAGEELVPRDGPMLLVANHLHNSDPIFAAVSCPRPVHFMAKRELFAIPVVRQVIRGVGAFPVDRGRADRVAIRRAQATLEQGIALGMFPEGTRSRTGALKEGLPGAGMIALRSGAPIVPMAIIGSERLPGNRLEACLGRFRRGVDVRMGAPFQLEMPDDGSRLTAGQATEQIMRAIAALLPEQYRGMYGESVGRTRSG